MAWTADDITALKAAIATGARTVTVDGKTVTYGSVREMVAILRLMDREVNGAPASSVRRVEFRRPGGGST